MASSSRTQSPIKRLLNELQTYNTDPNDALEHLGPVSDEELMHWTAIMVGVPGTAYEGISCRGALGHEETLSNWWQ
jgi:peroxin-4